MAGTDDRVAAAGTGQGISAGTHINVMSILWCQISTYHNFVLHPDDLRQMLCPNVKSHESIGADCCFALAPY